MIKINLANKKTAIGQKGGDALKIDAAAVTSALSGLRELPLKKYGSAAFVVLIATMGVQGYEDDQIKTLDLELQRLQAEKPKLQAEAGKMKALEDVQKSMEADEKIIRTKLDTIQKLSTDRASAVKLLQEFSKITPADVWLTLIEVKGNQVSLKGYSQDFGHISDFSKAIQNSSMFSDLNLKDTQAATDDLKRDVASFDVTAKRK